MYLLDTNVISEWTKPRPDSRVLAWLNAADEDNLYLSVIAFAEIRLGIVLLRAGHRREQLTTWVDEDLAQRFAGRVLPIDLRVAAAWAELTGSRRTRGATPAVLDALLAATAVVHGLTLVTRNVRDFAALGVDLFDPWAS